MLLEVTIFDPGESVVTPACTPAVHNQESSVVLVVVVAYDTEGVASGTAIVVAIPDFTGTFEARVCIQTNDNGIVLTDGFLDFVHLIDGEMEKLILVKERVEVGYFIYLGNIL